MENINKLIKERIKSLKESNYTFKSLFEIIHSNDNRIFCEYLDNYEIKYVTYNECANLSKKCASFFDVSIKDKKHEYVGLLMDNSLEWIISFWGLLIAGYKPALINDRLPLSLQEEVCKRLNIKTIVTKKSTITSLKVNKVIVDQDIIQNEKELTKEVWEDELALTTTATSLNIKVCIYTGKELTYQVLNAEKICKKNWMIKKHYKGSIKQLTFLPFYHVFGLIACYFWFSVFGRSFVFLKDFSPATILNTVKRHKVTHIFAVPMLWHTITSEITYNVNKMDKKTKEKFYKGLDLSIKLQNLLPHLGLKIAHKMFKEVTSEVFGDSVLFMISGGGYTKSETLKVLNGIGYPLYVGYGMSEIGITSVELRTKCKYRLFGSIGKPFESVNYQIKDNVLEVKGNSICHKILTKEKDILVDHNKYFNTNDIASMDKNGSYYITGRKDDVFVSSGGEKINPDYVESGLNLKNAKNYSVLGYDNNLTLVVELPKGASDLKIKRLLEEISELPKDNLITKIYFTFDEIANANAIKVSRNLLIKNINEKKVNLLPLNKFDKIKNKKYSEFEKDVKKTVQDTMASILNIDKSKIKDNSHFIFDLGGTSLNYLSLLVELEKIYDIKFVFTEKSASTLEEFCLYISKFLKEID